MPKPKVPSVKAKAQAPAPTPAPPPPPPGDVLAHIANRYNLYPGESVCFSTRLRLYRRGPAKARRAGDETALETGGYSLTVLAPRGLELRTYDPVNHPAVQSVGIEDAGEGARIHWRLSPDLSLAPESSKSRPEIIDFTAQAVVSQRVSYEAMQPFAMQLLLASYAVLRDAQGMVQASQTVQVTARSQSKVMRYLPEIYAGNEFLGRFMMLFESFWRDMELQIDHGELYYHPGVAPASFLPWLGSWIGLELEDDLPEDRKRRLLAAGVGLFRRRGTRRGLQEYLQIYTDATPERGGEVKILEHRGQNLVLGPAARMGVTSALGTQNRPHTFTIYLKVPRQALLELYPPGAPDSDAPSYEMVLKLFQRRLENLITAQKPAHTDFELKIRVLEEVAEI